MQHSGQTSVAQRSEIAKLAGAPAVTVSRALAGSSRVERGKGGQTLRCARERSHGVNSKTRNRRLQRTDSLSVFILRGHEAGPPLAVAVFVETPGHLADGVTQPTTLPADYERARADA